MFFNQTKNTEAPATLVDQVNSLTTAIRYAESITWLNSQPAGSAKIAYERARAAGMTDRDVLMASLAIISPYTHDALSMMKTGSVPITEKEREDLPEDTEHKLKLIESSTSEHLKQVGLKMAQELGSTINSILELARTANDDGMLLDVKDPLEDTDDAATA